MRKGRFSALFLLAVAIAGLVIGGLISFVLSSQSTDWAFVIVIVFSIVLAIVASSVRAARDGSDKEDDVRDVTAVVPLNRFVPAKKPETAADPPQPDSSSN